MHELMEMSREMRESAYAPYSEYAVGSSILTMDGSRYAGCNVEVSGLSNTIHAEEMAVVNAVADGSTDFEVICVSSSNGAAPCGMCRHTLNEFCDGELRVIIDSIDDGTHEEYTLSELHPRGFSAAKFHGGETEDR